VQEYLRLLLRHSGRHRMRRSPSTSVATTGPPHRGHAPGALCVPTTRSSSAPHITRTAPTIAISLALASCEGRRKKKAEKKTKRDVVGLDLLELESIYIHRETEAIKYMVF
jgi:hypothetical protein